MADVEVGGCDECPWYYWGRWMCDHPKVWDMPYCERRFKPVGAPPRWCPLRAEPTTVKLKEET